MPPILVHLSMVYACGQGHERCIYCTRGVEGPDELRDDPTAGPENPIWIASPFGGPRCRECGAPTRHVRWAEDEHFDPMIEAPAGATVFVYPGADIVRERYQSGRFGSSFLGDTIVVGKGA